MHARPATLILGALLVVTGMVPPDPLLLPDRFFVHAQAPHWTYSTRLDSSVGSVIVSYPVTRNNLGPAISDFRSKDQREHSLDDGKVRELWKYYTRLVPLIARKNLTTLDVFTDGPDKIAAAVYRDDDDEKKWHLAVDYQDAYDDGAIDREGMRDVLLHETGHMVTLSTEQVLVNYQQCSTYESDQGCSKASSYINRFYDQFWKTHANDLSRTPGQGLDTQSTQDFYIQHENEFLTPYASTGVEEDMAETFAYFIQHGKPYGSSIADQKVKFFYGFSFFVRLRKIIHRGLES